MQGNSSLCYEVAGRLIARAEQCSFLLRVKLRKKGFDAGVIDTALEALVKEGALDDGRFSRMWLRSRLSTKGASPRKLQAALLSKGIEKRDAEAALRDVLDADAERTLIERFVVKEGAKVDDGGGVARRAARIRSLLRGAGFSRDAIDGYMEDMSGNKDDSSEK